MVVVGWDGLEETGGISNEICKTCRVGNAKMHAAVNRG